MPKVNQTLFISLKLRLKKLRKQKDGFFYVIIRNGTPIVTELITKLTSILKLLNKIIGTIKRKHQLIS